MTTATFEATDTASHDAFYRNLPHKPDGAVLAFGLLESPDPLRVIDVNLMGAASILETIARDTERIFVRTPLRPSTGERK